LYFPRIPRPILNVKALSRLTKKVDSL